MSDYIIVYDLGNFNSMLGIGENIDPVTRRGGSFIRLLDSSSLHAEGIPSTCYWDPGLAPDKFLFGLEADRQRLTRNQVRYLKRHLGETIELFNHYDTSKQSTDPRQEVSRIPLGVKRSVNPDGTIIMYDQKGTEVSRGRAFKVDDLLVKVMQYHLNHANKQLHQQTGATTNKVALTYPDTYHSGQRNHLKSLLEKVTLEDGSHPTVVGTISESAASGLNYLAEYPNNAALTTIMNIDIGGGTTDIAIINAYPKGQPYSDGKGVKYYDILWTDGLRNVAGCEFTNALHKLFIRKLGFTPTGSFAETLLRDVEQKKRELSAWTSIDYDMYNKKTDADVSITVTRDEFETETKHLVNQMLAKIKEALDAPNVPTPSLIVLTGGACRMPMLLPAIEKAFPDFRGKVGCHKPSEAVASGAARYATEERDTDQRAPIQQRTAFDLGVCYCYSHNPDKYYIETFIPAGTAVPFASKQIRSTPSRPTDTSSFVVYEAKCKNPDKDNLQRDWRQVMCKHRKYNRVVSTDVESNSQLILDQDNMLHIVITDPNDTSMIPLEETTTDLNLSN